MSRFAVLLYFLLSTSVAFVPVGMHAHLDARDGDASTAHSGQVHADADEDTDGHRGHHVIDLHSTASVSSVHQTGKAPLLLLITLAPVLWILCRLILPVRLPVPVSLCSAPRKQTYWRPPMRGPPLSLV